MRKLNGEDVVTAELKLPFLYRFWRIEPNAFHVVVLKLLTFHLDILVKFLTGIAPSTQEFLISRPNVASNKNTFVTSF